MSNRIIYGADGNKVKEVVVHDAENFTMLSHYDISADLEYAKARREQGSDRKATYREVAKIPDPVMEQAFREGWATDKRKWAQWFNDPQNKVFHTDDSIKRISGLEGI
ncbi:hypothetical protein FF100_22080 [Methylobacterium terricola]|uniref:Uncharacterized protein n=1 Tax=Methylobacterium terricola TaxID=2583531 RepID=A0A5C4LCC1_9HYPH|nr:hypothetical protein [Methylobacterium terricola]TNC10842.1 hypothetical protein FF100_22080 [Methylobacterium terricola]